VAGLQLFYRLEVALRCPASGHWSHPIFNKYLLCLNCTDVQGFFFYIKKCRSWHLATSFL